MADKTVGAWAMVALQGLLFLLVVVAALVPTMGPSVWLSLPLSIVLILVGAAGMLWSGRDLGESLTPLPVPNGKGMAAKGIYQYARHPMYTAILLICLGVAVGAGKIQVYVVVLALVVFFEVKTRSEEKYLVKAYDGYAEYASHTGKFLPGIGKRRA
ncbi:methyltransferase family protein [Demequina aurantiaca]|uniref:methyltransferase family protein n=1 Tax=Demequina aurantiaca TaxID=676200 RepID=UPI000A04E943|nr:isoprenylcysteine carboxylmethyltransferase family protein [Demequina aurantiaca]